MDRRVGRSTSILLLVDLQEKLIPVIDSHEAVVRQSERILRAAGILEVPVVCTEQYPRGLGHTVEPIVGLLDAAAIREKTAFSCCGAEGLLDALRAASRPQVVIAGIETHVCVGQTVLDLLAEGFQVYVLADAVSSRRPFDRQIALERMRHAGAVVTTTEAVIFEWLQKAGTPEFKEVSKLVREL